MACNYKSKSNKSHSPSEWFNEKLYSASSGGSMDRKRLKASKSKERHTIYATAESHGATQLKYSMQDHQSSVVRTNCLRIAISITFVVIRFKRYLQGFTVTVIGVVFKRPVERKRQKDRRRRHIKKKCDANPNHDKTVASKPQESISPIQILWNEMMQSGYSDSDDDDSNPSQNTRTPHKVFSSLSIVEDLQKQRQQYEELEELHRQINSLVCQKDFARVAKAIIKTNIIDENSKYKLQFDLCNFKSDRKTVRRLQKIVPNRRNKIMIMKLLGSTESPQNENPVGYNFPRHPNESDFQQYPPKQPTWPTGDDAIINNQDKWKYNAPTIPGGISMQPNNGKPPHQILGHSQHQSHLQNHLNPTVLNHTLNQPVQMIPGGIFDHVHQSVNVNGVKPNEQLVYYSGQPHSGVMQPHQYPSNRNAAAITTSATKKLWEKPSVGDMKMPTSGPLGPWRDSTWSTQGEGILTSTHRPYPHQDNNQNTGILSPRDPTGGLGHKMVEYVLSSSPNKESSLTLEPRLRALKFDENDKSNDDKEKASSPFDSNGIKKEDQVNNSNGLIMNGEDDKGVFNRTPGSRQPSPAEESLNRSATLLDPATQHSFHQHQHLQHMLNASMDHHNNQLNSHSYHPQMMNHQMQGPVMNGGMQVAQNQMVGQQQGPNQIESPANLLQQPHNYDVQQLFRSQNPATNTGIPGQPSGAPQLQQTLPLSSQQYLAQQNAAFAAAQQSYVINPGQDAGPYMGLIAAGMPQYYGMGQWSVYPANLIPQPNQQPRRPLTPSQQGAENQPYQLISTYYDQNGCGPLVMGPRTGTPMRLVSPAPVMVPPGAQRTPQAPQIYPPQPQTGQQNLYSTQNGSGIAGLTLNTTSLSARRDSFGRDTSPFSPSLEYGNAAAAVTNPRKWPSTSYGALGTVPSASPIGAPLTPPPSGLPTLVRAPGAETKYRSVNHLAPSTLSATNAIFGSNNSLFSKLPGPLAAVRQPTVAAPVSVDRQPGRSRLLEDFRNQRHPNLQLRDLANHIVEFSQDQHGSRFIQQKLERATTAEKQLVFSEILSSAHSLMTDVFGNYVIQKFFEFGTPEQKSTLATQVKGNVLTLALQMYGCRVIQKALESIPPDQQQEIVRELDGHVIKCVKDQNGNHVVQKCIECVDPIALQFIINAFSNQVQPLSSHPYGCRVIQRILEHCTPEQTAPILAELHAHSENLIQDQYGNYVIQHVLEHGNALHIMMKDQYANYVVQKMIDVSEPTQRKILMHKIRPHVNSLRKYTYGKHIIAKLEKFFMKSSNAIGGSLGNATSTTSVFKLKKMG
ncbi:Maternal protein pumilio [Pseudolycoriella hygida]|uniref:Maternal protein pumilio n=1 Tax=Pseudolycoriella hygida TaxID=35572 RepID=A0A9Q0MQH5_9DIPT|nr:Maternal protein pumilio [Pseudolycoriella hygida]